MPNYGVTNLQSTSATAQALTSTFKTIIELAAATTGIKRGKLYEWKLGATTVPSSSDTYIEMDIMRKTAAGTGTASTPNPIDPADPACSATAIIDSTAEGTITANSQLDYAAMNQRAAAFWQAGPGDELVWPATNLNGIVMRCRSSLYTGTVGLSCKFRE